MKLPHHTNPYQSYPDDLVGKTIKLIGKAQENILLIVTEDLDNPIIINSLIKARLRGVQVGVITSSNANIAAISTLKNTGAIILINNGIRDINFYIMDGFDVIVNNTHLHNFSIAAVYQNEFVRIYQESERF
jgi:phosphatidylserine/phosphatidylglycerophosphate/cardiolipin synthase-like enzyme